jgi:acetyl-CoA carboxylase biotin carboxyl carrier protein
VPVERLTRGTREEIRVADALTSLSDDEVRQIAQVIESLDRSNFDFLQLEFGGMKLTVGKGQPPALASVPAAAPAVVAPQAPVAAAVERAAAPSPSIAAPAAASPGRAPASGPLEPSDTVAIVAPLLGRFYAQPEPGAPPFVSLGSTVTEDTTVGLIEVMKTFNAATAGVSGVIVEICVPDAQLVEYGQVLFRVRPTA